MPGGSKMAQINLRTGELRRRKGVSQQVMAEALGVAFQTVSKWENRAYSRIFRYCRSWRDISGYRWTSFWG